MTDRYPLDPRDEIRECSECNGRSPLSSCVPCTGRGYVVGRWMKTGRHPAGETGIFILAADQRVIEVGPYENRARTFKGFVAGYNFRETGSQFHFGETKDEALLAARCAVWGVTHCEPLGWGSPETAPYCYDTPTDALCAAIDARETR